ncbi:MAG TPA: dihydroxyacetone kinase subunit DhaL [Geminicoccaceae bacterium]|nr:dihydroxyacetone kinase subunit DhaL [Geminicoccus sp.]HMU49310.1 dihydroxyacetone kinase subunit DhaL [Geminicoccaceae bacterium]
MQPDVMRQLIDAASEVIISHAEQLTALDRAIGDGDHGANMARGFKEIAAQKDAIGALPLGQALQKAGMTLVLKVGGASGPLYGSLLMDMGKAVAAEELSLADAADMLDAGIAAVKRRGKAETGEKTMLDVLCPVAETLRRASLDGDVETVGTRMVSAAAHGLHRTSYMKATKGRASFLGERSIGHLDPGACSSALLVGAVVSVLEAQGQPS